MYWNTKKGRNVTFLFIPCNSIDHEYRERFTQLWSSEMLFRNTTYSEALTNVETVLQTSPSAECALGRGSKFQK